MADYPFLTINQFKFYPLQLRQQAKFELSFQMSVLCLHIEAKMGATKSKLDGDESNPPLPQSTTFSKLNSETASINTQIPLHSDANQIPLHSDDCDYKLDVTYEQWVQNCLAVGLRPWTGDHLNFKMMDHLKNHRLVMPTSRQLSICHYCHKSLTKTDLAKDAKWFGYRQVYCSSQSCETSARICRQLYLATNNMAQPDLNETKTPFIDVSGQQCFLIAYSFEISGRKPSQIYVKLNYPDRLDGDPDQVRRVRFLDFLIEQSRNFEVNKLLTQLEPKFDLYYPIEVKSQIEKTYLEFIRNI